MLCRMLDHARCRYYDRLALIAILLTAASCHRSGAPASAVGRPAESVVPMGSVVPLANAAPPPSSPVATDPSATAAAEAETLDISLENHCPRGIRIYWGDAPYKSIGFEYGIGPNQTRRPRVPVGTKVWLLENLGDNMSASTTVTHGTTEIDILDSCNAIVAR
jgi:hypothetical protein